MVWATAPFCVVSIYRIREKIMKGSLLKGTALLFALLAFWSVSTSDVLAGTGIYIGKDVSAEGTTVIGASTEYKYGFASVPVIIEKGTIRKGDVIECLNGYKYTMPEDNMKVLLKHEMSYIGNGQWNECASNEAGVSVISIITTRANDAAMEADPFVPDGVSEQKLAFILASTSKSAEEAVKNLCLMYDEIGAEAPEIVLIADSEGAWVVENFTGHEYVAVKLPGDVIGTFSNDPVIRTADPDDANTICSSKLLTLPVENDFAVYDENKNIDLILTYNFNNAYGHEEHIRGWVGHDVFAPSEELDYDEDTGYDVFFKPDDKVSISQAFSLFRNRFEGTAYDLRDPDNRSEYWGINNQRVSGVNVIQIFDDVPADRSTVLWTTPANPTSSPFIPIPVMTNSLPEEFATDVETEEYNDSVLQFRFAALNNNLVARRRAYGESVRQYWEGLESLGASEIASSVRGKWKDASVKDATVGANEYVASLVDAAGENCTRILNEFEWYLFQNGIYGNDVPEENLTPFECSFDALSYAKASGWQTNVENGVFTATKDGRTIEVVYEGDNAGAVSFTGFDDEKLAEEFGGEADADENGEAEAIEDKTAELEEKVEEEIKEVEDQPDTKKDEKAEDKNPEDKKSEEKKPEEKQDKDTAEELTEQAAKQLEVDTIAALENYFAEKIADVPRNGWAEGEIAKKLGDISNDVAGIFGKYFNGNIEDILNFNEAKAAEVASDPDVAKAAEKIAATGMDLAALTENYFASLYEDVSADIVSGRLNQDGAVKILSEAEADIEGVARLYIEGVAGKFAEVFNTDLTDEELNEILSELGEGAIDILDDYGVIDKEALGLDKVDLNELTDAEIDVVIQLDGMDDETLNGLSDILGVDVKSTLDAYIKQLDETAGNKVKFVEEKHEAEKADAPLEEEIVAAKELVEGALSEEDIVIPQEVIDILNEAIAEATGEAPTQETVVEEPAQDASDAEPAQDVASQQAPEEPEEEPEASSVYSVNIGNISTDGGKILLPANMIKFFK